MSMTLIFLLLRASVTYRVSLAMVLVRATTPCLETEYPIISRPNPGTIPAMDAVLMICTRPFYVKDSFYSFIVMSHQLYFILLFPMFK